MAKFKPKDGAKEEETIDSEQFTIMLRAAIVIQRAYKRYRYASKIPNNVLRKLWPFECTLNLSLHLL